MLEVHNVRRVHPTATRKLSMAFRFYHLFLDR